MSTILFTNISKSEDLLDAVQPLKILIEERINCPHYAEVNPVNLQSVNMAYRLALMASLGDSKFERTVRQIEKMKLKDHIHDTCFNWNNLQSLWSALLKLRWNHEQPDWENNSIKSRIINTEILHGIDILLQNGRIEEWLTHIPSADGFRSAVPRLLLDIGEYEGAIPAKLDMNGRSVPNTQVLIAGATGSGKSNLLAVLLHEIRELSVESEYPVNFLLFDYKGEFADPSNNHWLSYFSVDRSCIFKPVEQPLPFTPFKDFTGKTQNEINLYATELADALCSIDKANISAKMSDRLTNAVINAYNQTEGKPVHFDTILDAYTTLQEKDTVDSIRAVLNQLIRSNLFEREDRINLVEQCCIVKMDDFPKDGPVAKAIVYFIISKLNTLYEKLPKQVENEECVQLRHFTIIDEAHYMLDFDNRPLRNLIAVGRNKGLSIILATQNMDHFKSKHFDYYANAQYPLIMKQQTMADSVIKDLFGVSGHDFNEIKEAISSLKKGELIIKDSSAAVLGVGRKFKKVLVRHLI